MVPTGPNSNSQPPTGKNFDLGGLFCDQRSLPLGKNQDARYQAKRRGMASKEGEQHERFVERRLVCIRAREWPFAVRVCSKYVVGDYKVRVPKGFAGLSEVSDYGGVVSDFGLREDDADLQILLQEDDKNEKDEARVALVSPATSIVRRTNRIGPSSQDTRIHT